MTISAAQKDIIQDSFTEVAIESDRAAELFYNRLFEIAPATKELFKSADMSLQGQKLMQTLAVVIAGLDNLEQIVPSVQSLAKRHVSYGVTAEHYGLVGEALIWMLNEVLGDGFTEEAKSAWLEVYTLVAKTAIDAA